MPSLGATYGRGAATLPQWQLANSDCVLIMGSNMAEAHPVAFRFVMEAKAKGATVIHVDPRFTRTSAMADIYAPIRAGTDIAFLGGIVRYLLEHDLWFREYAMSYTNIATLIEERFVSADRTGVLDDRFHRRMQLRPHGDCQKGCRYERSSGARLQVLSPRGGGNGPSARRQGQRH